MVVYTILHSRFLKLKCDFYTPYIVTSRTTKQLLSSDKFPEHNLRLQLVRHRSHCLAVPFFADPAQLIPISTVELITVCNRDMLN